jgi:serine/threonine protein phosphatase 1
VWVSGTLAPVKRTFVIGDIHGDMFHLSQLMGKLPPLGPRDTLVFLGDYVDRGPASAGVVDYVRKLPQQTPAKVVTLRGNHEDAWLRVVDGGWPEFVIPRSNGCLEAYRSFKRLPAPQPDDAPEPHEFAEMLKGTFFPPDVVEWMRTLPYFYEDEFAIYVHAGIPKKGGAFAHPRDVEPKTALLWTRDTDFFQNYRGKTVVFGHTKTALLPSELSQYTPEDPEDMWAGPSVLGLDTGCGKGGFLTAVEFPRKRVYESRKRRRHVPPNTQRSPSSKRSG